MFRAQPLACKLLIRHTRANGIYFQACSFNHPVTIDRGFSHGEPTTLVRNLGSLAAYTIATPDHSRMLIRVSPDAAQDKGEMRLLFGWQDGPDESRRSEANA